MEVFDLRVMYDIKKLVRIALQRSSQNGAMFACQASTMLHLARRFAGDPKRTSIPREGIASDAVQVGTNCVERLGFYREGLMSKRRGCIGIAALLFGVMAA